MGSRAPDHRPLCRLVRNYYLFRLLMRVALYCRVSTDEQKQGGTIDSQIKELETFASTRGDTVVENYVDDGWSGSLLNRPALDALRDAAEQRLFEAVLINDVDRLSRDIANLAVVKRDLEKKGVDLIFRKLPTEKGPLSDFMVNILGSFAEFERAMITDRTRRGRRYKVQERQLIIGNKPPYGYSYVKKDREKGIEGHYKVIPEEARIVRMMFDWMANDGLSERAVTRKLNEIGVPPRHSRTWAGSSVHRILTNETYTGVTYYNKLKVGAPDESTPRARHRSRKRSYRPRPKSEWIAIPLPPELHLIDRETFERAEEQRCRNRTFSPRNVKHFYLLREVRKVCGRCGAAYVGIPSHGRTYYRCSNRDGLRRSADRPYCRAPVVNARKVDGAVWRAVEEAVRDPQLVAQQVNKLQEQAVAKRASSLEDVVSIERDLAALVQEEDRVLAAYRTGATSLRQFQKEIGGVNERRTVLDELLVKARCESPAVAREVDIHRDVAQWANLVRERLTALTDEERQRLVGGLLNEVLIEGDLVRVRGEIPAGGSPTCGPHPSSPNGSDDVSVNIAPTSSTERRRNPVYCFEQALRLL